MATWQNKLRPFRADRHVGLAGFVMLVVCLGYGQTKNSCLDCHSALPDPLGVRQETFSQDIHAEKGFRCARCHADASHMSGYKIPTNQFAEYHKSIHYDALVVRGDLSAPTCTTCHGNHGATPPGVASVVNVCSTCHVFQAQLFDSSPHKEAFASAGLPSCVSCHSNHG